MYMYIYIIIYIYIGILVTVILRYVYINGGSFCAVGYIDCRRVDPDTKDNTSSEFSGEMC